MSNTITVFKGDGIGPEITDAVLKILDKAGADLNYEIFNVGAKEYETNGKLIPDAAFASSLARMPTRLILPSFIILSN